MGTEFHVRPATEGDTGRILELVKLSLGEGKIPRRADYWHWKHHRNPFGSSPCLLAEAGGQIVGLRVFMRWNWDGAGVTVPAVRAVDTATHPEWRGKGIFSRLTLILLEQVKAEGLAFVFNTPNSQSRPGYLKMGWVSVGRTSLWIRPLRPLKVVRALLPFGTSKSATASSAAGANFGAPVEQLFDHPSFPGFLDELPRRGNGFATPRNLEYLRWRYATIPELEYRAAWSFDGHDGAAFIFRFDHRGNMTELRICEALVGSGHKSISMGRDTLRTLAGSAGHVLVVTAMASRGTAEQRVLARSGFLPAPRMGPVMTVRMLNGATGSLDPRRRSDWRLSIGDLELF